MCWALTLPAQIKTALSKVLGLVVTSQKSSWGSSGDPTFAQQLMWNCCSFLLLFFFPLAITANSRYLQSLSPSSPTGSLFHIYLQTPRLRNVLKEASPFSPLYPILGQLPSQSSSTSVVTPPWSRPSTPAPAALCLPSQPAYPIPCSNNPLVLW